jgi:hypothetical protein
VEFDKDELIEGLKQGLREESARCRLLETRIFELELELKQARIKSLPAQDLREVSEFTKNDFIAGRTYDPNIL